MRAIIIDDERPAREALSTLLQRYFPQVEVVAQAEDVAAGVRSIHTHHPDLVFLDIEMPGYSGLRLIEFFTPDQLNFMLVFVTAYNDYAVRAFEMSALDYLLKPTSKDDLARAINRASERLQQRGFAERIQSLEQNLQPSGARQIAVPFQDGYRFIHVNNIIRMEADGPYTTLYLHESDPIIASRNLKEFDDMLQGNDQFFRVHRSHLINLHFVSQYIKSDGGWLSMSDKSSIPVSRHRKNDLNLVIQKFIP